ncbi:antichymotrypsin-2-like protein [Leptotrombidium deliense]|uniref:Antichymotrypsin-2-like protein n=1 Tax=Leptotrombidium deliense TaxID=299467 RepID=A0A443RZM3_9ACAR|nr:antichymotrypsin-2-like protein [Leptotrombidium deliense]
MRKNDDYRYYAHSDKLKAAMMILEYKDGLSMVITLPDEKDGLPKLIENLKSEDMANEFAANMKMTNVDITLPKFSFDYSVDLMQVLPKMGVNIEKSLSALNPALQITGALHKARNETHEVGTEAAAVTVILAAGASLKPPPVPFNADHPFWFSIVDDKTGVVLFSGTLNQL